MEERLATLITAYGWLILGSILNSNLLAIGGIFFMIIYSILSISKMRKNDTNRKTPI